jgi:hypothetical protein
MACDAVNGVYVNVLKHQFTVTEQALASDGLFTFVTETWEVDSGGTLDAAPIWSTGEVTIRPNSGVTIPNVASEDHRASLSAGAPSFAEVYSLASGSPFSYPGSDVWEFANASVGQPMSFAGSPQAGFLAPNSLAGLFYNSNYFVSPIGLSCEFTNTSCAIRGTTPRTTTGTIFWWWKAGLPEFPFTNRAPIGEPTVPTTVNVTSAIVSGRLVLHWSSPSIAEGAVLNYTVQWGTTLAMDQSTSLVGTSQTISGFGSEAIYFSVTAWNLHGQGPRVIHKVTL